MHSKFTTTTIFITTLLSALLLTTTAIADKKMVFVSKSLMPDVALSVAKTALESCRKAGYQVTVSVVDSAGNIQVLLRDQLAGYVTIDTAILKAKTAMSFRTDTTALVEALESNPKTSGIKQIPGIIVLGGGVVIQAGGTRLGAIGVSGAPDPALDEICAKNGIASIQEGLDFL